MLTLLIVLGALALGYWFIRFSARARARAAQHEAAWAGWTEPGFDGLSRLQRECREILVRFITEHRLAASDERFDEEDPYIVAEISELEATVSLMLAQVDLDTPRRSWRWEHWDADQPSEIQRWLSEQLAVLINMRDSAGPGGVLRHTGQLLRALAESSPTRKEELPAWYERARQFQSFVEMNAESFGRWPHFVHHYLIDADIRVLDEAYRAEQQVQILEIIRALEDGRPPGDG